MSQCWATRTTSATCMTVPSGGLLILLVKRLKRVIRSICTDGTVMHVPLVLHASGNVLHNAQGREECDHTSSPGPTWTCLVVTYVVSRAPHAHPARLSHLSPGNFSDATHLQGLLPLWPPLSSFLPVSSTNFSINHVHGNEYSSKGQLQGEALSLGHNCVKTGDYSHSFKVAGRMIWRKI